MLPWPTPILSRVVDGYTFFTDTMRHIRLKSIVSFRSDNGERMSPPTTRIPKLPERERNAHKGDFGRAYIVGGSRGMAGAVALAAMAAHRAGAGLVTALVPDRILETVAGFSPNFTTVPVPDDEQGRFGASVIDSVRTLCEPATSIGLGPGLGRSESVTKLVGELASTLAKPMVIDADALNGLAKQTQLAGLADAPETRILTPHLGEFRRLVGESLEGNECRDRAVHFAAQHNAIVVLKGPATLVTDGQRRYENTTGNPGMATGGSGDVLTGIITGLIGQFASAFDAATTAVYLHGLAGDLAAHRLGEISLVASDLIDELPHAFQHHRAQHPTNK